MERRWRPWRLSAHHARCGTPKGQTANAAAETPLLHFSAPPITIKLVDDFPAILKPAEIPEKWSEAMTLIYRDRGIFFGETWLSVDGKGRALLIRAKQGHPDKPIPPGVYVATLSAEE